MTSAIGSVTSRPPPRKRTDARNRSLHGRILEPPGINIPTTIRATRTIAIASKPRTKTRVSVMSTSDVPSHSTVPPQHHGFRRATGPGYGGPLRVLRTAILAVAGGLLVAFAVNMLTPNPFATLGGP